MTTISAERSGKVSGEFSITSPGIQDSAFAKACFDDIKQPIHFAMVMELSREMIRSMIPEPSMKDLGDGRYQYTFPAIVEGSSWPCVELVQPLPSREAAGKLFAAIKGSIDAGDLPRMELWGEDGGDG